MCGGVCWGGVWCVCCVWCVVCGVWCVVCVVVCGMWYVVCGMLYVVCVVVCGMWYGIVSNILHLIVDCEQRSLLQKMVKSNNH